MGVGGGLWPGGGTGNLEGKYPESLAEKKKEGDFGSITEEGQELSLPKQQGEKGKGGVEKHPI